MSTTDDLVQMTLAGLDLPTDRPTTAPVVEPVAATEPAPDEEPADEPGFFAGKPLVRIADPRDTPDLARAASVALAIARHCKHNTWPELVAAINAGDVPTLKLLAQLHIDDDISELITTHEAVIGLLSVRPLLTVVVCPGCGGWTLTAGAVATRCKTTYRCDSNTAKPVKASISGKYKD